MKIDEHRWCPGGSSASQPRSYSQLVGRNQTWLALLRSATWLANQWKTWSADQKCRVFRSWKLPCQAFPSEFVVSARFVPTLDGSNRQCCCNVGWIPTPVYHVCFLHLFVLCPLDQLDKMQVSVSHKMLVKSTPSSIFWWSKPIILIHFAVWIRPIIKSNHWKQLTFFLSCSDPHFCSSHINQNESLQNTKSL